MNTFKKQIALTVVLALGTLACGAASAGVIVTNFDGMTNATTHGAFAFSYYDGGCDLALGGAPNDCDGPNYGVTYGEDDVGGTVGHGGFFTETSNEPSPPNVMQLTNGGFQEAWVTSVTGGFTTGFSFYYSAPDSFAGFVPAVVKVFSGTDNTGTVLATLDLPATASSCHVNLFSCWVPLGVAFSGTAQSVGFFSPNGNGAMVFDNVTFGSATPESGTPATAVPEPAALGMFGLGVLLLGGFMTLRWREQRQV